MVIRKYNSRLNTENGNTQYERETDRADNRTWIQSNGTLYIQCAQWALFIQVLQGLTKVLTSTLMLISELLILTPTIIPTRSIGPNGLSAPRWFGLTERSPSYPAPSFFSRSGPSRSVSIWSGSQPLQSIMPMLSLVTQQLCKDCPKELAKNIQVFPPYIHVHWNLITRTLGKS